ncbi:hypothetical protein BDW74DRAFT_150840 [Aspergillus multicolor]|uniref:uncharacterized protein n=1 Tax=Aspergillus multicolor TaxID=41759 RepID=UPI003CCE4D50
MNVLPLQILVGLSAAYFIWPGGTGPRIDHQMVASTWSFVSKLAGGSTSSSTKPPLFKAKDKDKFPASEPTNSSPAHVKAIYMGEAISDSTNPETQIDFVYWLEIILLVLFAALCCLWIARKVRSMIADEQIRQRIEKKIPDPVKTMFVRFQGIFGPFVQRVLNPAMEVFSPVIMISSTPFAKVFAPLNAILDFILAIPETAKNAYLAPFKELQEAESIKLKAIIGKQLDERDREIQKQLDKLTSHIEGFTAWQRQCEFYFMRDPKSEGENKAGEEA